MARIASKLNWTSDPDNAPLPSDFNRIENNNQQAFDELDAEVAARIADVNAEESARIADVNAEEARAIAAEGSEASTRATNDGTLQTNINNEASARSTGDTNTFNSVFSTLYTFGGVGSLVFATYAGTFIGPGSDVAGGNLYPVRIASGGSIHATPALSGTWRCLGGGCVTDSATLFIRIS